MSRDVTAAFAAALAEQHLRPVIFFEGQFATGWVRIWSGLGEIVLEWPNLGWGWIASGHRFS
ncbi:hypothetical protein RNZ50_26905 [Paracoccaceae bacterium Fryx2]|nr:hypothetical protein [Paracoccaceae bacterium Fryx2]